MDGGWRESGGWCVCVCVWCTWCVVGGGRWIMDAGWWVGWCLGGGRVAGWPVEDGVWRVGWAEVGCLKVKVDVSMTGGGWMEGAEW